MLLGLYGLAMPIVFQGLSQEGFKVPRAIQEVLRVGFFNGFWISMLNQGGFQS
jgi:hypothetical protein